jgi:hypothetical protein
MWLPIQRLMDEANHDALREELVALEAMEARVSAERRRLHDRIDAGFGSESARAREREVSDERRELHRRIDSLRDLLGVEKENVEPSGEKLAAVRELATESASERLPFPTSG